MYVIYKVIWILYFFCLNKKIIFFSQNILQMFSVNHIITFSACYIHLFYIIQQVYIHQYHIIFPGHLFIVWISVYTHVLCERFYTQQGLHLLFLLLAIFIFFFMNWIIHDTYTGTNSKSFEKLSPVSMLEKYKYICFIFIIVFFLDS